MPLFLSAFFQNTGLTIILVGTVFYLIDRFQASLFQLGLLSGIGAFIFMLGALSTQFLLRRVSPKRLTLLGAGIFALAALSYPVLPTLGSVYCVYPIGSFAMGLFWPSLENWISLEGGPESLNRRVGFFNLSWSPGQIIAPFLAGFLFEKGKCFPIGFGILLTLPVLFLLGNAPIQWMPQKKEVAVKKSPPGKFLVVAWLSNIGAWFATSIFRSLFPRYGLAVGLSPARIGIFLLLIGVGQVLFFFLLGRFEGWEKEPRFLFIFQGIAILSLLSIALAYHPFVWGLAFFFFGCFAGAAYSASLYVSLREKGGHGGGSSAHETLIGLGLSLGPLVGGGLGHFFGVRAPYFASAIVLSVILVIQSLLLRGSKV